MGVNYGCEKLYLAVRDAAVSDEPLQERLGACVWQLGRHGRESFPDDRTWKRFNSLREACENLPSVYRGKGAMTTQLTDEQARGYLREICDLFLVVAMAYGKEPSID
jgi:hypothetical protein